MRGAFAEHSSCVEGGGAGAEVARGGPVPSFLLALGLKPRHRGAGWPGAGHRAGGSGAGTVLDWRRADIRETIRKSAPRARDMFKKIRTEAVWINLLPFWAIQINNEHENQHQI